jgi:hypothetical protein
MICKKCSKGKIVLWGFSQGKCEICKSNIQTAHIPCDKLCDNCSEKHNLCKECGELIK